MINVGIYDGDIIIVEKRNTAKNLRNKLHFRILVTQNKRKACHTATSVVKSTALF